MSDSNRLKIIEMLTQGEKCNRMLFQKQIGTDDNHDECKGIGYMSHAKEGEQNGTV